MVKVQELCCQKYNCSYREISIFCSFTTYLTNYRFVNMIFCISDRHWHTRQLLYLALIAALKPLISNWQLKEKLVRTWTTAALYFLQIINQFDTEKIFFMNLQFWRKDGVKRKVCWRWSQAVGVWTETGRIHISLTGADKRVIKKYIALSQPGPASSQRFDWR